MIFDQLTGLVAGDMYIRFGKRDTEGNFDVTYKPLEDGRGNTYQYRVCSPATVFFKPLLTYGQL